MTARGLLPLLLLASLHAAAGWWRTGAFPAAGVRPRRIGVRRPPATGVAMDARRGRGVRRAENVDGEVFVDETCINCDTCR
jgi:hypothetical protein